jgi:hypothetical protein
MTQCLLSKIYKCAYGRYENDTKKLENKGEVFHLAANVEYRQSLVHVDPQFAKEFISYERKVTQKLEGIEPNELKWRKTLSLTSLLEEGDEEVLTKCTAEEIMNPLGTMPHDGWQKRDQVPEVPQILPEKKSVSPPNKFQAKLSKPVALPPPRKSQNPYLMNLISSGGAKAAEEKKTSPAKKILSAFNGKKSPAGAKRGSPGANANRRGSPGATAANKRGSPGASKLIPKEKDMK